MHLWHRQCKSRPRAVLVIPEVHFVDRTHEIGEFMELLLTVE